MAIANTEGLTPVVNPQGGRLGARKGWEAEPGMTLRAHGEAMRTIPTRLRIRWPRQHYVGMSCTGHAARLTPMDGLCAGVPDGKLRTRGARVNLARSRHPVRFHCRRVRAVGVRYSRHGVCERHPTTLRRCIAPAAVQVRCAHPTTGPPAG